MPGFITYVLLICFISPCLCTRFNVATTNNDIYNVMQYGAHGDGKSDDSQAFLTAWSNTCKSSGMSTLVIPAGKTFLVNRIQLRGPCNAKILIQIQGQIVAPSMGVLKGGPTWITIAGVNGLKIDGSGKGGIDGSGSTWWNCQTCVRPTVLSFDGCNDLSVSNLRISNSPRQHVTLTKCNDAKFSHIFINSPENSHNTDGFDINTSKNILIQDSNIKSGDDCIAINEGSSFINATRVTCGPGHGISVGSLGGNKKISEEVSNVYVFNCTFIETTNGARIKTFQGGSGYARQITFEKIILQNVYNPIIIDQEYTNSIAHTNGGVKVSDVTYRGFTGTSATPTAIQFICCSSGCSNIQLDQNNIVSVDPGKKISATCKNAHGIARNTIPNVPCLSN